MWQMMMMMTTTTTMTTTVRMLTITHVSLGELNESVFLLALLYLSFHRKSCVAAVMAKFKVLFQCLS
jgi:ABC-type transport system involved in cytochrome c biogenesis permease subunit